jgi:hypothetical protein
MASLVTVERQTTLSPSLPCSALLFHQDFLSLPTVALPRESEARATTHTPAAVVSALVKPRAPNRSPHLLRTTMRPLYRHPRLLQPKHLLPLHILTKQSRASPPSLTIRHIQALLTTAFQDIPLPTLQYTRARHTPHRPLQLLTSHRRLHLSRTRTPGIPMHPAMLTPSKL